MLASRGLRGHDCVQDAPGPLHTLSCLVLTAILGRTYCPHFIGRETIWKRLSCSKFHSTSKAELRCQIKGSTLYSVIGEHFRGTSLAQALFQALGYPSSKTAGALPSWDIPVGLRGALERPGISLTQQCPGVKGP